MEREIKGYVIGILVSVTLHAVLLLCTPLSPAPLLIVREIPGSIEVSLTLGQHTPIPPPHQKVEANRPHQVPDVGSSPSFVSEADPYTTGLPDLHGDSTSAVPQYEGNPKPPYPEIARRRGYEGQVRLEVEVSESGLVANIRIKRSSGYEVLDRSALQTVKGWRFIPARIAGVPVRSKVIIPVTFKLNE